MAIKKISVKKISASREVLLSDLDGIKKALLFFIEREREKELDDRLDYTMCGRFKNDDSRSKIREEIREEVNTKYDALTKGLK